MNQNDNAPLPTPTEEQFTALNQAYKYFNEVLFEGLLGGCILNFSRKKNTHGFLAPERWRRVEDQSEYIHEISLTPYTFYREPKEVFSTLVHEMAHLWQWDYGNPSRNGYHNSEWAAKMIEVGLMPSDTGKEGGKKTGQRMTHYIIPDGAYERAFNNMPESHLLPWTTLEGDLIKAQLKGQDSEKKEDGDKPTRKKQDRAKLIVSGRKKTKYSCRPCGNNVWGKPGLSLICGSCNSEYEVN